MQWMKRYCDSVNGGSLKRAWVRGQPFLPSSIEFFPFFSHPLFIFTLFSMAEEAAAATVEHSLSQPPPPLPPPFLEVICKSTGKVRRFAAGTEAGFAVCLINGKLDVGNSLVLHIEAVKEGEEPISFGPNSLLVDYGNGWKLQTVTQLQGIKKGESFRPTATMHMPTVTSSEGSHPVKRASQPAISSHYIGRIFLAFILIFLLGAILTVLLENLPRLILFLNSLM